jgi:hypothetical protein
MNYIKAVFSDIDYPFYFSITKYFPNSLSFYQPKIYYTINYDCNNKYGQNMKIQNAEIDQIL